MKKKGFTLIELLAVIVILAVIALIVTPIVTNIISQAKDSANARSVEGHIKGVEYLVLEASFKSSGNINKYDGTYPSNNVNLLARLANDGMHLQSSDKIDCEAYVVSNGLITEATGCKETGWSKIYNYTNTGGAVVSGSVGGNQTPSNPYLTRFDGNYTYANYDTFEENGSGGFVPVEFSNEWKAFFRNDGTKNEVCVVYSNGTVCLTSTYYNSNYSSAGSFDSDFEDCSSFEPQIFTSSNINNSCIKGYVKAKAVEMLSKGATRCTVGSGYSYTLSCDNVTEENNALGPYLEIQSDGKVYNSNGEGDYLMVDNEGNCSSF